MLHRIVIVLISTSALIALSAGVAQASPNTDPSPKTTSVSFTLGAKTELSKARMARANSATEVTAAQAPPGGGCAYWDVAAQGTSYYDSNTLKLTSTSLSFHAITTCTTTAAGQSMAGIIVDSSFWLNGNVKANGRTGSCSNCNGAQSLGSWVGGPSDYGTMWAGGLFIFKLPAGWIWTGLPSSCVLLSPTSPDTMECSSVSGTGYISPTLP